MSSPRRAGNAAIQEAASRLLTAFSTRVPCAPVRELLGSSDVDAAYATQATVVAGLAQGRMRPIGRKVGLTSPAVQAQLGVDQPDFGVLLPDMLVRPGTSIDLDSLIQPRIEAEVAFVLDTAIDHEVDASAIAQHVREARPAFEIVDSRIEGWDITLADTVADNGSAGLFVLGPAPRPANQIDLADVEMTMTANGVIVSQGRGSDCLGSPLAALAWLSRTCLRYGQPLQAGDIVLSGALGPMVPLRPGTRYRAQVTALGELDVTTGGDSHCARPKSP